jgi:hypothetical protein
MVLNAPSAWRSRAPDLAASLIVFGPSDKRRRHHASGGIHQHNLVVAHDVIFVLGGSL